MRRVLWMCIFVNFKFLFERLKMIEAANNQVEVSDAVIIFPHPRPVVSFPTLLQPLVSSDRTTTIVKGKIEVH